MPKPIMLYNIIALANVEGKCVECNIFQAFFCRIPTHTGNVNRVLLTNLSSRILNKDPQLCFPVRTLLGMTVLSTAVLPSSFQVGVVALQCPFQQIMEECFLGWCHQMKHFSPPSLFTPVSSPWVLHP